jgi:hypothetical protein
VDEKDPRDDTRLDLHDESGITRRDLMRRGAVVGGTLLWVAPAIQSIGAKAYAQEQGPSPGRCAACFCFDPINPRTTAPNLCNDDGQTGTRVSDVACAAFCATEGYRQSDWCSGTERCMCNSSDDPGPNGISCVES